MPGIPTTVELIHLAAPHPQSMRMAHGVTRVINRCEDAVVTQELGESYFGISPRQSLETTFRATRVFKQEKNGYRLRKAKAGLDGSTIVHLASTAIPSLMLASGNQTNTSKWREFVHKAAA